MAGPATEDQVAAMQLQTAESDIRSPESPRFRVEG